MQPQSPTGPTAPPPENPYRYGWRYVKRTGPDGKVEFDQVPLTLEDVLHPQEEDVILNNDVHEMECSYLAGVMRSRPLGPAHVKVTSDMLIDWGVPDLRDTGPDVAVFVGLREQPELGKGTFHLKEWGGRCLLTVEIVSPSTRVNDVVHKFHEYHQA